MVSALLQVMWRKTVERWEGTLAGKPTSQRNFLNHFMGQVITLEGTWGKLLKSRTNLRKRKKGISISCQVPATQVEVKCG
jgi:hypothetical protein